MTVLSASVAAAQTSPSQTGGQQPELTVGEHASTRPATTTFFGDTGLWFVPTAEVLPNGKWSVSGYRRGTNYIQGYTNVADFDGTFGVGLGGRAEVFGAFLFDTRIDRDLRPLFTNDPSVGGVIDRYPKAHQPWTGDNVGDLYLGTKINLLSEGRQNPVALAVRGMLKLATANTEVGNGTGKADGQIDLILSKEISKKVEWSGYGGYEFRGTPDGFDAGTGAFRWGTGVGFPSRNIVRVTGELNGTVPSQDSTSLLSGTTVIGSDGTSAPVTANTENLTRATVGVTFQSRKGVFIGAGVSWNAPTLARDPTRAEDSTSGDYWDWQLRIGYHPGVRDHAPPPSATLAPPPLPEPSAPQDRPSANRAPTVVAQCNPCTVEIGKDSTVTAEGRDPDGDLLTYRWNSPTGTFANPAGRQTTWTAPQLEGTVSVTVTASDGNGGAASDTVAIHVVRPAKTYTFEDVHFDFDRYSLRPEATRVLDEAVAAFGQDPTLRITIEGHTCNIGTAEYNLALGDRRANAVRDYLVSRGVPAGRLDTISYGEERPKYDNDREETRRLNRRAALVVRLQ